MRLLERVRKKIETYGEEFTLGSSTYHGVFAVLGSGNMRSYLDDVELMGVARPALMLVTSSEVPLAVNDHVTRDGRTYTVLKTSNHRIGETTVVKIAILA
ncbi:MAG: hypothetical protein QHI38_13680 [Armatimonadota bacterium]|nr:hypothetical protein [Armatimonadota bacterium]